jgi:hypothetical protein
MTDSAIHVLQNEAQDGPLPIPTNERMVFLVPSEKDPRVKYRVDLLANLGAGWCQCADFGTRKQGALDAGATTWMAQTSCKHSRRAMRYVMRRTLGELAARENRATLL